MTENQEKVLSALQSPSYWKPNLSQIARDFNIPAATVHDIWNKLKNDGIKIKVNMTPRIRMEMNGVVSIFDGKHRGD